MDRNSQQIQRGRPVSGMDAAHANEYFEQFLNATSLKHILGYYRGLTDNLHLKPNVFPLFYPKLRANLTSWRAKALWKKFDARASHKCYQKGKLAGNTRVLIIGGGPCGMRSAIEAQLLGAKVVVVEKRDRFSRNNVLHLWPFVIEDLRMLGAKKFFGKFCAGAIDHISIRQLQCILLKVALLLGVEVHTEVSFEKLIEPNPNEKTGWRAEVKPPNHPVHNYEFDVIIGADGKRNTLQGFSRKEFRGKLAIAITANFINRKTEAEARVEEISGVAFIFNQKFFKDLQEETRIDLENIVYYKDDTHYFVMTAKKASLLEKGVIKQDLADTEKLLAPDNVDRKALEQYAIDAANFSTNYQLPNLEFAVNHYGQPDIAMFDFTSMYAAENASKVLERNGYPLLMILVGDSLLEPFWPTGSGCARGFLSSLDAAWAIRSWSLGTYTALDVLAERESIYRLLAQTTPDNLNKDWKSYTVDPSTRYPNLNKTAVIPHQVTALFDTDNPSSVEKMKRNLNEAVNEVPRKRRRGNVDNEILLGWLRQQLKDEPVELGNSIESVFKGGKALCAIIHHYRPDLLDYSAVVDEEPGKNNQMAFDILEKELGIPPVMTGEEIAKTEDYLTMATYLTEIYDTFRREIPHIKHPKITTPQKLSLSPIQQKISKLITFSRPEPPSCNSEKPKIKCCGHVGCKSRQSLVLSKTPTKVVSIDPCSKLSEKSLKNKKNQSKTRQSNKKRAIEESKSKRSVKESVDSNIDFKKSEAGNGEELEKAVVDECMKEKVSQIEIDEKDEKDQLNCVESKHEIRKNNENNSESNRIFVNSLNKKERVRNLVIKLLSRMNRMKEVKESEDKTKEPSPAPALPVPPAVENPCPPCLNIYNIQATTNNYFGNEKPKNLEKTHPIPLISSCPSNDTLVTINLIEKKSMNKFTVQKIEYRSSSNVLTISSKTKLIKRDTKRKACATEFFPKENETKESEFVLENTDGYGMTFGKLLGELGKSTASTECLGTFKNSSKVRGVEMNYHRRSKSQEKNSRCDKICECDLYKTTNDAKSHENENLFIEPLFKPKPRSYVKMPLNRYDMTSKWVQSSDFLTSGQPVEPIKHDKAPGKSKFSKVSFNINDLDSKYKDLVVEKRTKVVNLKKKGGKPRVSSFKMRSIRIPSMRNFCNVKEKRECDLPESRKGPSEVSFKTIKTNVGFPGMTSTGQQSRPSSRHKRHITEAPPTKIGSMDKKTRKRRTLERVGATVDVLFWQFLGSLCEIFKLSVALIIFDLLISPEQYGLPRLLL